MTEEKPTIECRLCRKEYELKHSFHENRPIDEWTKVCVDCKKLWELGKKREKAAKADGKLGHAAVKLVIKTDGREGDPKGDTTIKSGDIIAAMGGVKLKGTSIVGRFSTPKGTIQIGRAGEWDWGGTEIIQVPEARAKAMDKVLSAFHAALAKARVDGFNEGRNLLAGLADGSVKVADYSEQADNARVGKRPRGRF